MNEIKLGAWIDECRVRGVERYWGETRTMTKKGGRQVGSRLLLRQAGDP